MSLDKGTYFSVSSLEKISKKEMKKIRKNEDKIKMSKAGATLSDKMGKWAAFLSALGVVVLSGFNAKQSIDTKKYEKQVKEINFMKQVSKINNKRIK